MASSTADSAGFATDKTFEHYARLVEAGAGLAIVEYTFVHPSGRSEDNQLGASTDEHIDGLQKIAEIIKQSGSVAGVQLTHGGGKSDTTLTAGDFMAPSAIPVPVKGETLETPRVMSSAEIEIWKSAFAAAIGRAVAAGFDLVELHSAHGYGLNQFLSPITNHREDEYGATLLGRSRLLREIVSEARKRYPDLLISVRMPGQDFMPNGLTTADSTTVAKWLEACGASVIHVSSGIGGWKRPVERRGEGYLVPEAAIIQANVSLPVIGVGGIETADYIDQGLREKKFSLAAVGRAILKDPAGWRKKVLSYPVRTEHRSELRIPTGDCSHPRCESSV